VAVHRLRRTALKIIASVVPRHAGNRGDQGMLGIVENTWAGRRAYTVPLITGSSNHSVLKWTVVTMVFPWQSGSCSDGAIDFDTGLTGAGTGSRAVTLSKQVPMIPEPLTVPPAQTPLTLMNWIPWRSRA